MINQLLDKEKREPHEKLLAECKGTYTHFRLELEEITKKLKEGTISLEKIAS